MNKSAGNNSKAEILPANQVEPEYESDDDDEPRGCCTKLIYRFFGRNKKFSPQNSEKYASKTKGSQVISKKALDSLSRTK